MQRFKTAIIYTFLSLLIIGAASVCFAYVSSQNKTQPVTAQVVEEKLPETTELLMLGNVERENNGLQALVVNDRLNMAAKNKAADMLNRGYWSHDAPDGTEPWTFIRNSGYNFEYAGENLARNYETAEEVVEGWLNSPTHKENMLNAKYTEVGYAVESGMINNRKTIIVVAMYANPNN